MTKPPLLSDYVSSPCDMCGRTVRCLEAHKIMWHEAYRPVFMARLLDSIDPHGVGLHPEGLAIEVLRKLDPRCERVLVLTDVVLSMAMVMRAHERHGDNTDNFVQDVQETVELCVHTVLPPHDVDIVLAAARGRTGRAPISELELEVDTQMPPHDAILPISALRKPVNMKRLITESTRYLATSHHIIHRDRVKNMMARYSDPDGGPRHAVLDVLSAQSRAIWCHHKYKNSGDGEQDIEDDDENQQMSQLSTAERRVISETVLQNSVSRASSYSMPPNGAYHHHHQTNAMHRPVTLMHSPVTPVYNGFLNNNSLAEPSPMRSYMPSMAQHQLHHHHHASGTASPATTTTDSIVPPSVSSCVSSSVLVMSTPHMCELCMRRFKDEPNVIKHKLARHKEYLEKWQAIVEYHTQPTGLVSKKTLSIPDEVVAALDPTMSRYLILKTHIVSLDYIRQSLTYLRDVFLVVTEIKNHVENDSTLPVVPTALSRPEYNHLSVVVFSMAINTNPTTCDVCSRAFRDVVPLVQHKIQKHREVMMEVSARLQSMVPHPPGIMGVRDISLPEFVLRCLTGADTDVILVLSSVLVTRQLVEELLAEHQDYTAAARALTASVEELKGITLGTTDLERLERWMEGLTFTCGCRWCNSADVKGQIVTMSVPATGDDTNKKKTQCFMCAKCQPLRTFCHQCGEMEPEEQKIGGDVLLKFKFDGDAPYCPSCWAMWEVEQRRAVEASAAGSTNDEEVAGENGKEGKKTDDDAVATAAKVVSRNGAAAAAAATTKSTTTAASKRVKSSSPPPPPPLRTSTSSIVHREGPAAAASSAATFKAKGVVSAPSPLPTVSQ
eukprot:PhM_4_TR2674/c0_g1_i1/m.20228